MLKWAFFQDGTYKENIVNNHSRLLPAILKQLQ